MGEKRGRAGANGDEQQAPMDGSTRRTAGMTHNGTGSEAKRYRKNVPFQSAQNTNERERQDGRRQHRATQPQKGGRRTYKKEGYI